MSVLFFTSGSFCGCDPALEIGASLLVMLVATAVVHVESFTSLIPAWGRRAAMRAGYLGVAAVIIFGGTRTLDNLQRLL